jgi:hypothetical protein
MSSNALSKSAPFCPLSLSSFALVGVAYGGGKARLDLAAADQSLELPAELRVNPAGLKGKHLADSCCGTQLRQGGNNAENMRVGRGLRMCQCHISDCMSPSGHADRHEYGSARDSLRESQVHNRRGCE